MTPSSLSLPPPRRRFSLSVSGRILFFTLVVWVGLLLGLQGVLDRVFRPTFVTIENDLMVKDLERIDEAVAREAEQLGTLAKDYASWDETRALLEEGSALPPSSVFGPTSLKTLDLESIFVFDELGREVHSLNSKTKEEISLVREFSPRGFAAQFPVIVSARVQGSQNNASRRGLVRFRGGALVFAAAAPIVSKMKEGRALGTIVLLRQLDASAIKRIAAQVRLELALRAETPQQFAPNASEAKPVLHLGEISASAWLRDPFGQPIARFSLSRAASILARGEDTLLLAGLGSLFTLSLVLAVLLLLLQLSIVRPLRFLTQTIEEARRSGKVDVRFDMKRTDEIGLLAYNFDRLMSLLGERSRVLSELATIDGLTNLYNRRTIMEYLGSQIALTTEGTQGPSVLLLDVDHFKRVNDTVGHSIGDRVLRQVATTLKQNLDSSASAGRYGGEEFLVILPNTSRTDAVLIGEALRKTIEKTPVQGLDWPVTVSIGVATWEHHTIHGLLATADLNLYRAKESGRNRVVADEIPLSRLPAASIPPPLPPSNHNNPFLDSVG